TFLAAAGTTVIWAGVSQALVTKIGVRSVMTAGLVFLGAALYWYTRIPVHGHYWPDLLPAYLVFAVGIAFAFVPVSIAALAGVSSQQSGLASGLINTTQQIGGAVGVAVAATIFTSYARPRHFAPGALTTRSQHAFWALLATALAGALASAVLLRREDVPLEATASAPVGAD